MKALITTVLTVVTLIVGIALWAGVADKSPDIQLLCAMLTVFYAGLTVLAFNKLKR